MPVCVSSDKCMHVRATIQRRQSVIGLLMPDCLSPVTYNPDWRCTRTPVKYGGFAHAKPPGTLWVKEQRMASKCLVLCSLFFVLAACNLSHAGSSNRQNRTTSERNCARLDLDNIRKYYDEYAVYPQQERQDDRRRVWWPGALFQYRPGDRSAAVRPGGRAGRREPADLPGAVDCD